MMLEHLSPGVMRLVRTPMAVCSVRAWMEGPVTVLEHVSVLQALRYAYYMLSDMFMANYSMIMNSYVIKLKIGEKKELDLCWGIENTCLCYWTLFTHMLRCLSLVLNTIKTHVTYMYLSSMNTIHTSRLTYLSLVLNTIHKQINIMPILGAENYPHMQVNMPVLGT